MPNRRSILCDVPLLWYGHATPSRYVLRGPHERMQPPALAPNKSATSLSLEDEFSEALQRILMVKRRWKLGLALAYWLQKVIA